MKTKIKFNPEYVNHTLNVDFKFSPVSEIKLKFDDTNYKNNMYEECLHVCFFTYTIYYKFPGLDDEIKKVCKVLIPPLESTFCISFVDYTADFITRMEFKYSNHLNFEGVLGVEVNVNEFIPQQNFYFDGIGNYDIKIALNSKNIFAFAKAIRKRPDLAFEEFVINDCQTIIELIKKSEIQDTASYILFNELQKRSHLLSGVNALTIKKWYWLLESGHLT